MMTSFEKKLQDWIVSEIDGLCGASMVSIPSVSGLQQITDGKNKQMWEYVIKYVKSKNKVRHIRNVLRVKRGQSELNNLYPFVKKSNCEALKREINKTEEKVEFLKSSLFNTRKNIFDLKEAIKSLRGKNHILSQKCTFLKVEILNYEKKNETFTAVLEHLFSLVQIVFSNDGIKCPQHLNTQNILDVSNINLQLPEDTIRFLLFQMASIVESEFLKKGDKISYSEISESLKMIGKKSSALDFVSIMKQQMKKSVDLLNENNSLASEFAHQPQQSKLRLSSEYLQLLKKDQINNQLFRIKMINYSNKMPSLEKVISSENGIVFNTENEMIQDFIIAKVENACMEENIKYLESVLQSELQKTKNILGTNSEQISKCVILKSVAHDLNQKLRCIHVLVKSTPETFSDSENRLSLISNFLKSHLFSSLSQSKELNVLDIKNYLQSNYAGSLDILQSKHFLKSLLIRSESEVLEIPEGYWKLLDMKPFNSFHLLCENIVYIKNKIAFEETVFKYDAEDIKEPLEYMTESLMNKFNYLKSITESVQTETKSDCKNLKSCFDEWCSQKAQCIPEIVYDGKTLKMWIDICNALSDF